MTPTGWIVAAAAFAVAATLYVATGLVIGWLGGLLERRLRILR